MFKPSIRQTLIIPSIIVILTSGVFVSYFSLQNSINSVNSVAEKLRQEMLGRVTDHLQNFLSTPQNVLHENARALSEGILDRDNQEMLERHFVRQNIEYGSFNSIYFGNTEGGVVVGGQEGEEKLQYVISTDNFKAGSFSKFRSDETGKRGETLLTLPNYDARKRQWYEAGASSEDGTWGDIYILFTGQDMSIPPSRAVRERDGTLLGVVAGDIFLSGLSLFLKNLHAERAGISFIMDGEGLMVASSTSEKPFSVSKDGKIKKRLPATESATLEIVEAAKKIKKHLGDLNSIDAHHSLGFEIDDQHNFVEIAPFRDKYGLFWLVATVVPEIAYTEQVIKGNSRTLYIIFAAFLFMAIISAFLARWLTRPILDLTRTANAVANGDLSQNLKIDRRDEIGDLSRSFQKMTGQLEETFKDLKNNEENLRVTLDSIGDAVIATDVSGNVTRMNPVAESLCGWKQDEAVGKHMGEVFNIINANTREPAFNPVNTVLAEGKTVGLANHTILVSKDGFEYQIADSAAPIRNDTGDILGVVLVFRDVTEEYAVRQVLNDALVNAEQANQAKSEFLASMSHELRTPLNAVLGFSQMLQFTPKSPLSSSQNEYVENILEGGNHLLELVNEILDLASIEADKVNLSLIDLNANDVVSNCVDLVVPLGEPRGIKIIDQFSKGPMVLLFTDRMRLKQILINLLSNAIKFNKDGGTVTVEGKEAGYGYLRISVSDTGIGVAKEDQSSVFNLFHRVGSDPTVAREGTGIGLTVTKLLVGRMAGRIGLESEEGVGSTFWIDIPLASNEDVLIWTEAIKVGADVVDKDHQVLIFMLNRLTRRSTDDTDVDDIINELIVYTESHFSREEAIMEVCGYPEIEEHRDLHRRFINDVNQHAEAWRNERSQESLSSLHKFLRDWLLNHILKEDTKIAISAKGKDREIRHKLEALGLVH